MDWKVIGKKLLYPPLWLILLLVVISAGSLVAVFLMGQDTSPLAIVAYVVSFYTLTVNSALCFDVLPGWIRAIKQKAGGNQYLSRYMTDVEFKTRVSLYRSLTINLLYAGVNILSVILYRSAWFAILAVYYTILALMRFLLLRFFRHTGVGKDRIREFRRSRLCGLILMTINLTLSGAVLMILYQDKGYEYHGFMIYVMAMFTFYITIHAIVNVVKYRKYNSPVMSTSKIISLSAALVSMLSLETAMFSRFGADTAPELRRIMISATGGAVSLIVVTMSVYMILLANREIKKIRSK